MVMSAAVFFLGACLITLTTSLETEACAELILKDRQGEISSPNFPLQYYPNTCTIWTVQKKPYGSVVIVSFAYLDFSQDSDDSSCNTNYIELGSPGYKKIICSRQAKAFTSFPYDMQFYIKFVSGPVPRGLGFRLEYFVGPWYLTHCPEDQFHCGSGKCIPGLWKCNGRQECEQGVDEQFCQDIHNTYTPQTVPWRRTSGTLQPFYYPNVTSPTPACSYVLRNSTGQFKLLVTPSSVYQNCSWLIDVPGNVDRIVLRFLQLDIFSDAYIWVYKGRQANISNSLGRFDSGSETPIVTVHSSSVLVEFRLAFDNPAFLSRNLYFYAKYSAFPSDSDTYVTPTPAPHESVCYQQLSQKAGNFSMPPAPFSSSSLIRSCVWHIYKPYSGYGSGSYIHLIISGILMQPGESIKVFDGSSSLSSTLIVINSNQIDQPVNLRSTGLDMMVYFTTQHERSLEDIRLVAFEAKYHYEDSCELGREMHCGSEDNRCFTRVQGCDGNWDCPLTGTDEEGCDMCPEHSFSCGSFSKCYYKQDRCSGTSICPNDADELNCNEQLCSESRNLFLCANKRCILSAFVCDETNDCGDNSDEEGCSLGNTRKVIVAAVVGALLCSLLLVLFMGCACKFYYLRHHHHHHQHHHRGSGPRYDTPLTRLQAEMFRRRAPPPPYHEAMLTSRPYDEAVREFLAQAQQRSQEPQPAPPHGRSMEQGEAGNVHHDTSVHNLISLMDFTEQGENQDEDFDQHTARLEIHLPSDSSSDSESEEEGEEPGNTILAEDDSSEIEIMESICQGSPTTSLGAQEGSEGFQDNNEDSASASLSADSTEVTSLEGGGEGVKEEGTKDRQAEEDSDKENGSDADSVCILCLDDDPSTVARDDGSDTTCLLQDV